MMVVESAVPNYDSSNEAKAHNTSTIHRFQSVFWIVALYAILEEFRIALETSIIA